jgi:uncharacterized protein YerC
MELGAITTKIADLQRQVVELSNQRKKLTTIARQAGASTGTIAEACGLRRGSYPVRK